MCDSGGREEGKGGERGMCIDYLQGFWVYPLVMWTDEGLQHGVDKLKVCI